MSEEVGIVDTYLRMVPNKTLLIPLPDPLLITHVVADYVVKRLKMAPIAYLSLGGPQPVMYSLGGVAVRPFSLYFSGREPLVVFKTPPKVEEAAAARLFAKASAALVRWAERNEFDKIVMLDVKGEREGGGVYFTTEEHYAKEMRDMGFEPFSGLMASEAAILLDECMRSRVTGVILLVGSKSLAKYEEVMERIRREGRYSERDLEELMEMATKFEADAARRAIEAISRVSGVEIPLDKLDEHVREFEKAARAVLEELFKTRVRGWPPPTMIR